MAEKPLSEILAGRTAFGRLRVTGEGARRGRNRTAACTCDCGKAVEVLTFSLTSGRTQSCGCLQRERQSATAKVVGLANKRHGESQKRTPEYSAWLSMHSRCGNPRHRAYANYGGRGIAVCERWAAFENFLADMGRRPSEKHSLDREDNDRGYEPGNCRWATDSEQNSNRRRPRSPAK